MRLAAKRPEAGRLELLESIYLRVAALIFLALGLKAWMRVTGLLEGPDLRFDTMSDPWRLASAVLCVLLPVAALGLWARQAWGVVLWVAAASAAIAMHVVLPELFGRDDLLVAFHILGLLLLAAFRAAIAVFANRK